VGCLRQRGAGWPPGKLNEAARAYLEAPPTAAELASFGFTPADYANEPPIDVWPELWAGFRLFSQLQTQWVCGFNGPVGLRYTSLYPLLDQIAERDTPAWQHVFADVQTLERYALDHFREQAEAAAEQAERERRSRSS
jgi:hypothetical protein